MPYVDNEGVSIHYIVEGEGPPLVLQHGLGAALENWHQAGYVEALKEKYQLIMIDARGHGASSKPHDRGAYRLESMVTDLVSVLDDLKVNKAHYFGYSFGGWIGWGIAKYSPERFHSLIIGGCGPPRKIDPEEPNAFLDLFQKKMDTVLATLESMFGQWWTPEIKAMAQANDLEALIALVSAPDWVGLDYTELPPTVTVPSLLLVGEAAGEYADAKDAVESMPTATCVSFPDLDHVDALFRSDLVLPHIIKFLAEVGEGRE